MKTALSGSGIKADLSEPSSIDLSPTGPALAAPVGESEWLLSLLYEGS